MATCPETSLREPVRALALAERALEQEEEAFILDTYAEALFLNGRRAEALEAARRAVAGAKEKQAYYRDQVRRFEDALQREGVQNFKD